MGFTLFFSPIPINKGEVRKVRNWMQASFTTCSKNTIRKWLYYQIISSSGVPIYSNMGCMDKAETIYYYSNNTREVLIVVLLLTKHTRYTWFSSRSGEFLKGTEHTVANAYNNNTKANVPMGSLRSTFAKARLVFWEAIAASRLLQAIQTGDLDIVITWTMLIIVFINIPVVSVVRDYIPENWNQ